MDYIAIIATETLGNDKFEPGDVIEAFHPSMLGPLMVSEHKAANSVDGSDRSLVHVTNPGPEHQALKAELRALMIAGITPQKALPFAARDVDDPMTILRKCLLCVDLSALPAARRAEVNARHAVARSLAGAEVVFREKPLRAGERLVR